LRNTPVVRASLERMSADQLMTWEWGAEIPAPPASAWTSGTAYAAGDRVTHTPATTRYVAIAAHTSATATNEPPNVAYWAVEGDPKDVPVLLDGWGNPILFVPSGGLTDAFAESNIQTPPGPPSPAKLVVSSEIVDLRRPFFASAGPDGIFGREPGSDGSLDTADDIMGGDDNIYSFEN
jgi:hypothetical protein